MIILADIENISMNLTIEEFVKYNYTNIYEKFFGDTSDFERRLSEVCKNMRNLFEFSNLEEDLAKYNKEEKYPEDIEMEIAELEEELNYLEVRKDDITEEINRLENQKQALIMQERKFMLEI